MPKHKRFKKRTVFGVIEGVKTENNFLTFLLSIYLNDNLTSFKVDTIHGGNPNTLIERAKKHLHYGYDQLFVWIDEDIDLSDESRNILFQCWKVANEAKQKFLSSSLKNLQKTYNTSIRNPILIVSQPVCVEALILNTLGHSSRYSEYNPEKRQQQIKDLKNALAGVFGKKEALEFYRENLSKNDLEKKRAQIPELNLLIEIITGILHKTSLTNN